MPNFVRDLRYALRSLWKTPQFTLIAVATLALAIGANAAIFGLLDRLLFRNLAVFEPERLVLIDLPGPFGGTTHGGSYMQDYPLYQDLQQAPAGTFTGIAAVYAAPVSLTVGKETERATSLVVSGNAFEVFGLQPAAGRLFSGDDDRAREAHPVVVLSHAFWQRRFAGASSAVGQSILVNNHPMEVVGVAPPKFDGTDFDNRADVFVPMSMKTWITPTWDGVDDRTNRWVQIFARLGDGVSLETAQSRIQPIVQQAAAAYMERFTGGSASWRERVARRSAVLQPAGAGFSPIRSDTGAAMWTLMALVACVLVIACANISGLIIARFLRRERELAIRLALGAGKSDLVRLTIMESICISVSGALGGLALAEWCGQAIAAAQPFEWMAGLLDEQFVDTRVLLYSIAITVSVALLFGTLPHLSFRIRGIVPALRHGAGSISGANSSIRLRKALVVGQIAICLPVMFGAGLFARSFLNLSTTELGVKTAHIIQFNVDPVLNGYTQERAQSFFRQLEDELYALGGTEHVGMAENPLYSGDVYSLTMSAPGRTPATGVSRNVSANHINPNYFQTVGIPQLAGRNFRTDESAGQRVAIISQETARRFFEAENPIGRQMCFGDGNPGDPCAEIVGLVKDSKHSWASEETPALFYMPVSQQEGTGRVTFYVRSKLPADQAIPAARNVVQKLDPNLPVFGVRTLEKQLDASMVTQKLVSLLSSGFGALATVLAALGLYGVMSYLVLTRTKEIGLRMALGAPSQQVVRMVLHDVGLMVLLGILLAVPLCVATGIGVRSMLYEVRAWDPISVAVSALILLTAALVAGGIPATVAARVSPMVALRDE